MGPLDGAMELSKALVEAGYNLLKPHSSTDETLTLLDEIESLLSTVEQDPIESVQTALMSPMNALVSAHLLRNPYSDVRVYVISCLTEIMRITAPEAPYNDNHMKDIFQVTIEVFGKLADTSCRSYKKVEGVLETVSKVRSSLVMLDLECDDLVLEMFRQFLKIIRPDHPQTVLLSMETIMITVIDESEEVPMDLLEILLTTVKKENQDASPAALALVEKVLSSCACKLQPSIMEALKSSGTSLDMYSPVVSSICQSESAATQAHNVVKAKENEADEKISEEQVVLSDSLEDKVNMGLSRKGNRSKRTARGGTRRANGDDKVKTGNGLKQGQSESTDAETESGSTRKRGRKANSLMNPEEGYSFKTSASKKVQEKEIGDSSVGKGTAKKASLRTKVGQTNQSVVISLSPSGKARTGLHKRSRTQMEERKHDEPTSKKQIVKKGNPEEDDLMESNLEKPEDGIKTAKSSKKEKTQNGLAKTSSKKPLAESKMLKASGKQLVHLDAKKKNSAGASMNTPTPRSSKSKKMNSRATKSATKKSVQTPTSQPKRKRTAGEEVESNTKEELGEELVGKRVKVWWPLDKMFYEGVVDSYCGLKKKHKIEYTDGDEEERNLNKERFVIIQDNSSAIEDEEIDLPESVPLSELLQIQKAKKRKNVAKNVQPNSSPEVRSSTRTMKKKEEEEDKATESKVEEKEAAMSEAKLQESKEVKKVGTSPGSG